jgi:hypothetical protein
VSNALAELAADPELRGRWVAIDPSGSRAPTSTTDSPPLSVALRSGGVVIDADPELDELCRRLKEGQRTALTIVFAGARAS